MMTEKNFKGSATELCEKLKGKFGGEFYPNHLTRDFFKHAYELHGYGVSFEHKRSNGQRILKLSYSADSDGSDGKKLMPAELKVTDPTVTVQDVERSKNVENTEFSDTDNIFEGDGKSKNSDGNSPSSDGNFAIVNGKKVKLFTMNFDDVLMQSAARLRRKLAERKR